MAIDPSGRGKDETAYAVVKYLNGWLYLVESGGFLSGFEDATLQALAETAKRHKANYCVIESNFGGGMFTKLLQPWLEKIHPVTCEDVVHSKQKELRIIDTLEPVLNQHKLVVDPAVIRADYRSVADRLGDNAEQYSLMWQLTHISRDRGSLQHDDRLDVLSIAVDYWGKLMGVNVDLAVQKRQEEEWDQQLRSFHEGIFGGDRPMRRMSFTDTI
jgi:hypothetical protein